MIVSRDRPASVCTCLDSLEHAHRAAFPETVSLVFVVDDSTSPLETDRLQTSISNLRLTLLNPIIIGNDYYKQLKDDVSAVLPRSIGLFDRSCRPLGSEGWNLFSARNFIWLLLASHLPDDQMICMLDDDVLAGSATYGGVEYVPTAWRLLKRINECAPNSDYLAVGPRFLGREDLPILRHIVKSFRTFSRNGRYDGFPYHIATSCKYLDREDPVPSGGFMLTNVATIRAVPLLPFYNEDWIWAKMISLFPRAHVDRTPEFAVHGPQENHLPTAEEICFQELGEAVYAAIVLLIKKFHCAALTPYLVLKHLDQGLLDVVLRRRIAYMARCTREVANAINTLSIGTIDMVHPMQEWTQCCLTTAREQLEQLDSADIIETIHSFLPVVRIWPQIAGQLANHRQGSLDSATFQVETA